MQNNNSEQIMMNANDAAKMINVPVSRIRNLVHKKAIPFIKIGKSVRFARKDLEAWLDGMKVEAFEIQRKPCAVQTLDPQIVNEL